jgi:hypothetical protein
VIAQEDQQQINGILSEAESALSSNNINEVKNSLSNVESAANRITAMMLSMAEA